MDTNLLDARSIFTAVSLVTFLGIMVWAYSGRQKAAFAEAANLPFADDELENHTNNMQSREKHNV